MKKTIYIATPYRAETKEQFDKQLEYTKMIARDEVLKGNDVIVPHLYYPQFLDDNVDEERTLGMLSAKNLILVCDEVVVGIGFGISVGVQAEIAFAQEHNKLIREVL